MAQSPSQSIEQFCADRSSPAFAKKLIKDAANLMSFQNQGGIANGGVCWWHSRFQRNATYVTIYKPAEPRPDASEVRKIVNEIRSGKKIVIIPGYRNFGEFSYYQANAIQAELEQWQRGDGFLRFGWVNGLKGKNIVSAERMAALMDELYDYVETEGNIAYQKLQIKGIDAHAWLVVNMKKVSNGYDLEILDSNYPSSTNFYKYRLGQTHFNHEYYGKFTPYLERKAEMEKLTLTVLKQCDPDEYERKSKHKIKEDV